MTSSQPAKLTIDTTNVRKVFAGMPKVAYFWLRDFLGQSFGRHRIQWFALKGTRFGRGGIKVYQVNDGPSTPGPHDVLYQVRPVEKRAADRASAEKGLAQMTADAFTGNNVLPVHEFGEDIKSSRFMAIPVGTRVSRGQIGLAAPGHAKTTPATWRQANPGKQLIARPSKRDNKVLLYEVSRKRLRGRPGKSFIGPGLGAPGPVGQEQLKLRFVLTRFVDMKPTLKMYSTWDGLDGDRDKLWQAAADKMLRDFDKADPRDI